MAPIELELDLVQPHLRPFSRVHRQPMTRLFVSDALQLTILIEWQDQSVQI